MKRMWYLRCSNCGAYITGLVDILEPCKECGQVVMWKKAFVVEFACREGINNRFSNKKINFPERI